MLTALEISLALVVEVVASDPARARALGAALDETLRNESLPAGTRDALQRLRDVLGAPHDRRH